MCVVIPIRTESAIRRTPTINYLLIGANVLFFLLFHDALSGSMMAEFKSQHLALSSDQPVFG